MPTMCQAPPVDSSNAVSCSHANESPGVDPCGCPPACYCRVHGNCPSVEGSPEKIMTLPRIVYLVRQTTGRFKQQLVPGVPDAAVVAYRIKGHRYFCPWCLSEAGNGGEQLKTFKTDGGLDRHVGRHHPAYHDQEKQVRAGEHNPTLLSEIWPATRLEYTPPPPAFENADRDVPPGHQELPPRTVNEHQAAMLNREADRILGSGKPEATATVSPCTGEPTSCKITISNLELSVQGPGLNLADLLSQLSEVLGKLGSG